MKKPVAHKRTTEAHGLRYVLAAATSLFMAWPAHAGSLAESLLQGVAQPRIQVKGQHSNNILQGEDISKDTRGNAVGFVALVEADDKNGGGLVRCVGAAVATDVVVTSGHCLLGVRNVRVKFISSLSPLDYETVPASDFKAHPLTNKGDSGELYDNFNEDTSYKYHDIGVILLDSPSNYAVPVTLTPVDLFPEELPDSHYFVFGRGRNFKTRAYKGNIEFARVLSPRPLRSGPNYYKAMLDVGEEAPQAVCQADSGGPVTISAQDEYIAGRNVHYLIGIFAFQRRRMQPADVPAAAKQFGSEDAIPACGMEMGYVNIHTELVWIEKTLAEMDPANPRTLTVFGRD